MYCTVHWSIARIRLRLSRLVSDRSHCLKARADLYQLFKRSEMIRSTKAILQFEPLLIGRVEMWRGGSRFGLSVAAPFVWRCPSNLALTPFPHPAHRTGHADCPHPALGQDLTPSPTTRRAQVGTGVRDRSTRTGARVDTSRPGVAGPCTCGATTDVTAQRCSCRAPGMHG